ncbi:spore germination protein [Cytobacillus sp. Hz8]|uniref:spore germination protein n=1 Tax=Cytobacillus sp. Hz8 TaxID=3347168 RepID=UPI0035E27BA7
MNLAKTTWTRLIQKWIKNPEYPQISSKKEIKIKEQSVSSDLDGMLKIMRQIYHYPENLDVKFREFRIRELNKRAAVIFITTIVDVKEMEDSIIKPLVLNADKDKKIQDIVTVQTIDEIPIIQEVLNEVNKGNTILLVDGISHAYSFNTTKLPSRSIEKTENEITLRGPKESFIENPQVNIALIRKKIKNENLVVEANIVSKRSRNDIYLIYVRDLVNDQLLQNVKDKLNKIDVDSIGNISILEQYIEERPLSIFPTILNSERPDRAASFLEEGSIVMVMDNSPSCLILPVTFWSFYQNPEEHYLRLPSANFTRILRGFALFISVFSSAIYIAVTNYHSEMIPPDLLFAISASREKVPFPGIVEILLMEIAFELIREAGLRVPTPIGPTIGIVGALILGQAAVQANIISPLIIIVVALGGLSSFAINDISFNYAVRLMKFFFILSAFSFGIYGMVALFVIGIHYMTSIKSFGVPYFAPMTPRYASSRGMILRKLLRNELYRPGYLKPKDMEKKGRN